MAKRSAKKVARHGAGRPGARRGTRAYCRICRGPHTKRQHWSHKYGTRTRGSTKRTAKYFPSYSRADRPQLGKRKRAGAKRTMTRAERRAMNRARAARLRAASKRTTRRVTSKRTIKRRGLSKKAKAALARGRARARAERMKLRGDIGFAAFAGAARGGARRRALEAAEARGASKAARAAVKVSRKEAADIRERRPRRLGGKPKMGGLPRTPFSR